MSKPLIKIFNTVKMILGKVCFPSCVQSERIKAILWTWHWAYNNNTLNGNGNWTLSFISYVILSIIHPLLPCFLSEIWHDKTCLKEGLWSIKCENVWIFSAVAWSMIGAQYRFQLHRVREVPPPPEYSGWLVAEPPPSLPDITVSWFLWLPGKRPRDF